MSHSILITGGSGYLGGDLLVELLNTKLPPHKELYAMVRNEQQAEQAKKHYQATPLVLDVADEAAVTAAIVERNISIVFFLIDAFKSDKQIVMIKALGMVKEKTGQDVHFLHTSGAKLFSGHAGHPTDCVLSDADPELHKIHSTSRSSFGPMNIAVQTNLQIIDAAEKNGVRSYIFIPCIVYGESRTFGNKISIQTKAIVKAAKKLRQVYDVNDGTPSWPVCHVSDNSTLYVALLRAILSDQTVGHDREGFYLASSGSVQWRELYEAMAEALAKRDVVDTAEVFKADASVVEKMGDALGVPKEFVEVELAGDCTLEANRGKTIGWKSKFGPRHVLASAEHEVEIVLRDLEV